MEALAILSLKSLAHYKCSAIKVKLIFISLLVASVFKVNGKNIKPKKK